MADNNISGRLALITGASGGIGAAIAYRLAAAGCHLALTYSSNRTSIDTILSSLQADYPKLRVSIHKVDMASTEEIAEMFKEIRQSHDDAVVDILIPNAGYGKRTVDIEDIPLSEYEYTMAVNLRAPFVLVQGVARAMKAQRWGRIVFTSSIAAYGTSVNGAHYAVSKGGLLSLTKRLAVQLGPYNISVNDVAPGMVGNTGMIPDAASVPGVVDKIPIGRLGTPEEVANAVLMFVQTGFATGQSLVVAGGLK